MNTDDFDVFTAEALAQQKSTWNSTPQYDSEEQMAAYLRASAARCAR